MDVHYLPFLGADFFPTYMGVSPILPSLGSMESCWPYASNCVVRIFSRYVPLLRRMAKQRSLWSRGKHQTVRDCMTITQRYCSFGPSTRKRIHVKKVALRSGELGREFNSGQGRLSGNWRCYRLYLCSISKTELFFWKGSLSLALGSKSRCSSLKHTSPSIILASKGSPSGCRSCRSPNRFLLG